MEPMKFASILSEKLEKIKHERDIEEKWDNKLIKNLSEVVKKKKGNHATIYLIFQNCLYFSLSLIVNLAKSMILKCWMKCSEHL